MGFVKKLYISLSKVSDKASRILESVSAILIAACTLTLLFQVLYRFVIIKFVSFSFPFTEEFARYALIWSVYLVIGVCLKEGTQASVNFVYDRLKLPAKTVLYYITRIFMAIFLAVTLIASVNVMQGISFFRSSTLRIPGTFLYSAPLVGCLLMAFETLVEVLGVISKEIEPFGVRARGNDAI
jgi:TRAP-type C4-dicarboxylate transport system permease small subunit